MIDIDYLKKLHNKAKCSFSDMDEFNSYMYEHFNEIITYIEDLERELEYYKERDELEWENYLDQG